jgi:hypothetical protein
MAGRDPQLPQEGTYIREHSFEKIGHMPLSSRNRDFYIPFKISAPIGFTDTIKATQPDVTGLIPQKLQREAQINLTSLDGCHKSGERTRSCVRRSVCFCSQNG